MLLMLFSLYLLFIWIVINSKIFLWRQYLKNWYIRKVKFRNAKNSTVFYVKCFLISQILRLSGSK